MARFGFRLARVRELREAQERQAQAAVAVATQEVNRRQEALYAACDALHLAGEPLRGGAGAAWSTHVKGRAGGGGRDQSASPLSNQPMTAGDLRATAAFVQRLRTERNRAELALDAAAAERAGRVRDAVAAWQAARILQALRDRRYAAWARDQESQAQNVIDDRTGAAWQRRDSL